MPRVGAVRGEEGEREGGGEQVEHAVVARGVDGQLERDRGRRGEGAQRGVGREEERGQRQLDEPHGAKEVGERPEAEGEGCE